MNVLEPLTPVQEWMLKYKLRRLKKLVAMITWTPHERERTIKNMKDIEELMVDFTGIETQQWEWDNEAGKMIYYEHH